MRNVSTQIEVYHRKSIMPAADRTPAGFCGQKRGVRCRRAGLTLMELLVTVGIMVIMILTFGQILSSSQKAVNVSQTAMRTGSAGSAIEKVIRDDLRKITKNGFLCITQASDGSPRLVAVTAGVTPSKTGTDIGNGGIIALGLCDNLAGSLPIFYHQAWVLAGSGGTPGVGSDILNYDMESVVRLPRHDASNYDMNELAEFVGLTWAPPSSDTPNRSISLPTSDIDDVVALWQVLASESYALSIQWTDGTDTGNNLNWYGIDGSGGSYSITAKTSWSGVNIANDPNQIEFNAGGGAYRALWTKDNQSNWPVAIRIQFTISNPAVIGTEEASREYEIIAPVGQ